MNQHNICANCNSHLVSKYCAECGQKGGQHEINFHYIYHEIQHGLFHVDRGIWYTIKQLYTRPGKMIQEFIDGKRVIHFKPIGMVIILATIHYFIIKSSSHQTYLEDFITGIHNGLTDDKDIKDTRLINLLISLNKNYTYTILLLIPLYALSSFWVYGRINFWQHLVLQCYITSQKLIMMIIVMLFTILITLDSDIKETIKFALSLLLTIWALSQFFNELPLWKKIVKALLFFIVFALLSFISIAIITIASQALNG
jgi:hypothetical protein